MGRVHENRTSNLLNSRSSSTTLGPTGLVSSTTLVKCDWKNMSIRTRCWFRLSVGCYVLCRSHPQRREDGVLRYSTRKL